MAVLPWKVMEKMSDKIKLIIWDLDETLWDGTLSDGAVSEKKELTDLLKKMAHRGVISAVCSKNDEAQAAKELGRMGLTDYIVLSSVSWESKGSRIHDIISTLQLRPCNVLFVDDNMSNLQEARYVEPDIQVVLADKVLSEIASGNLVFDEKDDSSLTRLDQYKTLMERKTSEKQYSSNEEFLYYSDIRVELSEDNTDRIGRIYEMIHRNNQLNFTKDRISEDEVRALFLDPEVRSGCVSVRDKFGDHGIVGCYALKNGRLEQFVFSCRILNMGVEQWVYSVLGYPEITVVEPVASQLKNDYVPSWINQTGVSTDARQQTDNSRIIVYGSCPLRPIWAYLQPVFTDSYFAEIDPEPSICNLAVAAAEPEEYTDHLLQHVKTFNRKYTFDRNVFSDATDYVLISLDEALGFLKYSRDGHSFFSKELTPDSADEQILREYEKSPVTCEDVRRALTVIADNLKGATLLIMNNPEVEFPIKGRNSDYRRRAELNRMAEEFSRGRENVRIIDIRNYAKSPTDFYDTYAGHFNRNIAYRVSRDIIRLIAPQQDPEGAASLFEGNHRKKTEQLITDESVTIETAIGLTNGTLTFGISETGEGGELTGCGFDYEIYCGNIRELFLENSSEACISMNCDQPGDYRVSFAIRRGDSVIHRGVSEKIEYSEYNYIFFEDAREEGYPAHLEGMKQFCENNAVYSKLTDEYIADIAKLTAAGVSLSDYFTERGISEISVLTDDALGSVVIPLLAASGIGIKHIYCVGSRGFFDCDGGQKVLLADDVNSISLEKGDNVFLAYSGRRFEKWNSLFQMMGVSTHTVSYVISALKTKAFFIDRAEKNGLPRVICVRCPHLHPFYSFPYTGVLPSEKTGEKLSCRIPENDLDSLHMLRCFKDGQCSDFTVMGGMRLTTGQPEKADRNIYIFGDSYVFGYGVEDSKTIPSQLQKMYEGSKVRVHNMSNIWYMTDGDHMIRSVFARSYGPGDIIVICLSSYRQPGAERRWHWMNWEQLGKCDSVECLDGFPLFLTQGRERYFLAKGAYTAAGNLAMAELIKQYLDKDEKR